MVATSTPERLSCLVPGHWLDRYELLCPVAEGGMASVWIARLQGKHGFEKLVAIKMILAAHADDPRFQQMFLDEARIASRIEHSNVAQILDLGDEQGILYIVMEWVNGDSLSYLHRAVQRKGRKLPLGIVLRILSDACGGLHAAHGLHDMGGVSLGVVHRDVSPQNVLVSENGIAKVIDFGIAMARDRLTTETHAGVYKGKLRYIAPEQALGKRVDRRADIWAMGAVFYYLLEGRPPFEGENELDLLHRLTSGAPVPPLSPDVPAPMREIVEKTLAYDREERYASAAELQSAFDWAMSTAGVATKVADVAAFCQQYLGERSAARKKSIVAALEAAAERGRSQKLLMPSRTQKRSRQDAEEVPSRSPMPASPRSPGSGASLLIRVSTPDGVARTPSDPPASKGPTAILRVDGPASPARAGRRALFASAALVAVIGLVGVVRTVRPDRSMSAFGQNTDKEAIPTGPVPVFSAAALTVVEPPLADSAPTPAPTQSADLSGAPTRSPVRSKPSAAPPKLRRNDYGF